MAACTAYTVDGLYASDKIEQPEEAESSLTKEALDSQDCASVVEEKADAGEKKKDNNTEFDIFPVDLMIKDPLGNPYIPGSSLKGAIRTALLNQMISEYPQAGSCFTPEIISKVLISKEIKELGKKLLQEEFKNVESNYLHKLNVKKAKLNALNSVMRGLSISDSEPLEPSCLTLCRKIDYDITGRNPSYINLLRECLKPETEVHFTLTLDQDILKKAGIDKAYIEEAIKNFYTLQNQRFVSKFQGFEEDAQDERCVLYLGGGCGFHSKTLLQQLLKEKAAPNTARLLKFLFPGGYHDTDEACGVSPHMIKGTLINNTKVLMGKCEVQFGG